MKAILFIALCILGTVSAQTCITEKTEGLPTAEELLNANECATLNEDYDVETWWVYHTLYSIQQPGCRGYIFGSKFKIQYNGNVDSTTACTTSKKCQIKDLTTAGCVGCTNAAATNYDADATWHDESLCTYPIATPCNVGDFDCTALKGEYNGKCSC